MTDQTQKLEKFKQAVFDEAAEKAAEIIKETEEQCAENEPHKKDADDMLPEKANQMAEVNPEWFEDQAIRDIFFLRLEIVKRAQAK